MERNSSVKTDDSVQLRIEHFKAFHICQLVDGCGPIAKVLLEKVAVLPFVVTVLCAPLRCPLEQRYSVLCSWKVRRACRHEEAFTDNIFSQSRMFKLERKTKQ